MSNGIFMSTLSRSTAAVLCLLVAPASSLMAQDDVSSMPVPRYDLSAGYAAMRDATHDRTFPAGWYVSVAVNMNQWFGIVGEVTGSYAETWQTTFEEGRITSDRRDYTVMAGARFFGKFGRAVPFAQILAGLARERQETESVFEGLSSSGSLDFNRFAVQPGGGITLYLTEHLGVRAGGDYRCVMDFEDEAEFTNIFRFAAGVTAQWEGS